MLLAPGTGTLNNTEQDLPYIWTVEKPGDFEMNRDPSRKFYRDIIGCLISMGDLHIIQIRTPLRVLSVPMPGCILVACLAD